MKAVLKALAILVGVAVAITAAGVMYVRNTGVSARAEPGAIETAIASRVRNLAIGRHARGLVNPVERTPEIIAAGRAHFADHCASCHANDGGGDTALGRGLFPKPPDMRLGRTQDLSDGELFYIIENGVRFTGMPGWGTGESSGESASWHLVHFIRHLPELSEAELAEMERLNPVPPDEVRQRILEEQFLQGGDPVAPQSSRPHKH